MLRNIGGFILGFVAGLLALMLVAYVGGTLYPIPPDATARGPVEQAVAAIQVAPLAAKLFIAFSWFVGGLVGGWIAKLVSGRRAVAWSTVAALTLIVVANIFLAPFPAWMEIASVAAPLLGGLIGSHLARERAVLPPEATSTTEA